VERLHLDMIYIDCGLCDVYNRERCFPACVSVCLSVGYIIGRSIDH